MFKFESRMYSFQALLRRFSSKIPQIQKFSRALNLIRISRRKLAAPNTPKIGTTCRIPDFDTILSRPTSSTSGGVSNMAAQCIELTSENVKDFLDSFDTVLFDCDGKNRENSFNDWWHSF